jgi:uncharacterized protein YaaN involved in tellurite resistance|tara:strand:- start:32 stop:196 length:165 start_codon:yes stop_codon:yes gene_type:complete
MTKKNNIRGPNDLEEIIERLEKNNEELKKDNWTLAKEIDRLNEYVQVLEMEKKK